MDPSFQAFLQAQMASTVATMTPLLSMVRDEMKKDREAGAAKASGGTTLDDAKRYRLCGYSHVAGEFEKLQPIWALYEGTRDMETLKGYFMDGVTAWAGNQPELIIDDNFKLSDEFMKMLVGVANFSQDEAVPVWRNFEKGFCPLIFLREDPDIQREKQEEEEDERNTAHNRTRDEARAIRKSKRDPRDPPATLEKLTVAVATLAGVISIHFGQACPLYEALMQLHTILRTKQVQTKTTLSKFVLATWWFAIMCDWRQYFDEKMTAKSFGPGKTPTFPTSMIATEFSLIQKGISVPHGSFPNPSGDSAVTTRRRPLRIPPARGVAAVGGEVLEASARTPPTTTIAIRRRGRIGKTIPITEETTTKIMGGETAPTAGSREDSKASKAEPTMAVGGGNNNKPRPPMIHVWRTSTRGFVATWSGTTRNAAQ
jgi:hypothetical protein